MNREPPDDDRDRRPETPAPHLRPDDPAIRAPGDAIGRSTKPQPKTQEDQVTEQPKKPPKLRSAKGKQREQATQNDARTRESLDLTHIMEAKERDRAYDQVMNDLKEERKQVLHEIEMQGYLSDARIEALLDVDQRIAGHARSSVASNERQTQGEARDRSDLEQVIYQYRKLEERKYDHEASRKSLSHEFLDRGHPGSSSSPTNDKDMER